jgi:plasmid stabilization system protein ParE
VKIVYTRKALAQIDRICSYIEARDSAAALKVKTRIKRSIDRLAHRPYSARPAGRPRADSDSLSLYRALHVDEVAQQVRILRVRHTAQNPAHHHD